MTTLLAPTKPAPLTITREVTDAADRVARRHAFGEFRQRKAANTLRRHDDDLTTFARFLVTVKARKGDDHTLGTELATTPDAWRGVTFELVANFVQWLLGEGMAVSTANVKLSTVKTYAALALKAGVLADAEYTLIRTVRGYSRKEGIRVDEKRTTTRTSTEKTGPTRLTVEQAKQLKAQPMDTSQGRRDAVLVCLLLNLGLRVSELTGLQVSDVNLRDCTLTFYRSKVNKTQTHTLTNGTLAALKAYIESGDAPTTGALLRASRKGGHLTHSGMSRMSVFNRVHELGEAIGVHQLSPHDCRHFWATQAARNGTPINRLRDAGGWTSLAMPGRYIEAATIANDGVIVEE